MGPQGPAGADGLDGAVGPQGPAGPQGTPGSSYAGQWSDSGNYEIGQMVLYNSRPFWAVTNNPTATPGSEVLDCDFWQQASYLDWVGVAGIDTLTTCSWDGELTSDTNFRSISGTQYWPLIGDSTFIEPTTLGDASITVSQAVFVTSLLLDVKSSPNTRRDTFTVNVLIDGVEVSTCVAESTSSTNQFYTAECAVNATAETGSSVTLEFVEGEFTNFQNNAKFAVSDYLRWFLSYRNL